LGFSVYTNSPPPRSIIGGLTQNSMQADALPLVKQYDKIRWIAVGSRLNSTRQKGPWKTKHWKKLKAAYISRKSPKHPLRASSSWDC
jgi:hypothetical protein